MKTGSILGLIGGVSNKAAYSVDHFCMKKAIFLFRYFAAISAFINGQIAVGQLPCISDFQISDSCYTLSGEIYSGKYSSFYCNGVLREEGYILEGKLDGIVEFYNNQGDTTALYWYNEGLLKKRRLFTYNPTGKIVTTLDNDDKLHGLSVKYYPNGNIKNRQLFYHGESVGKWFTWDKKGRIIVETDFTGEVIIRKIHDYKWGRHKVLIQHFDMETNEVVFKNVEKN